MAVSSREEYWNTNGFRLSKSHSRDLCSQESPGNIQLLLKAPYTEVKLSSKRRYGYKKPVPINKTCHRSSVINSRPGVKKQNWRDRKSYPAAQSQRGYTPFGVWVSPRMETHKLCRQSTPV